MDKMKVNKLFVAKSNVPLYFGFILLTITNFLYVFFEIRRRNIRTAMGYEFTETSVYEVTKAEMEQISALSDYPILFEASFLVILFVCVWLLFKKRSKALLTPLLVIIFLLLSLLFIINLSLAAIFNHPPVNLIQHLFISFQVLVLAFIYGFYKIKLSADKHQIIVR